MQHAVCMAKINNRDGGSAAVTPLNRRVCVAPMMDWTDCAEKAKWHQRLSMVAIGHAVPMLLISFTSE